MSSLRRSIPMDLLLRSASSALWDHVVKPQVTKKTDIPWSIEAITPEWLTDVLFDANNEARVTNLKIDTRSSGTSIRGRLLVSYNEAGQDLNFPETFFCKSTPTFVTRIANGVSKTMRYEANFYNQLRRELKIEAPIGYFSNYSLRSFRSIHLLEDLAKTQQAQFCDVTTSISRANAEDAVKLLATLHGRFYCEPRFYTDLSWLPTFKEWFHAGIAGTNLESFHTKGVAHAESVIPRPLLANREEIWPAFLRSLDINDTLPKTLLHSDVHLANWYIGRSGKMGLCDWQCVSKGHWGRDLAYALSTLLSVDDRRTWERDLVHLYIAEIESCSGVKVTFDEAWLRYRQSLLAAMVMWTPTLCPPSFLPDMQPADLSMELVKRISTAANDLETLASLV